MLKKRNYYRITENSRRNFNLDLEKFKVKSEKTPADSHAWYQESIKSWRLGEQKI